MRVNLKLYGVFKSAAGVDAIGVDIPDSEPTIRCAISELASRPGCSQLQKLIFAADSADPRSNALILLGGREIGALAGLDTKLKQGDELSLLPIAHGG